MKIKLLFIVLALGLLTAACGTTEAEQDDSVRDDSGEIIEGAETGVLALQEGDCWNDGSATQISSVETVACDEPHDNQLVGFVDLPDGDWTGQAQTGEDSQALCDETFGYLFDNEQNLDLSLFPVYPTEQGWEAGDREVQCSLYASDLSKLTEDRLG